MERRRFSTECLILFRILNVWRRHGRRNGSSHGSGGLTCSSSTNGLETNSLKENLEDTFVLSGKLNNKLEGKKNLINMSCSGIVVDKVSFSDVEASAYLSTMKFISCKVNGRDVPLTLIENENVLENLIYSIF